MFIINGISENDNINKEFLIVNFKWKIKIASAHYYIMGTGYPSDYTLYLYNNIRAQDLSASI